MKKKIYLSIAALVCTASLQAQPLPYPSQQDAKKFTSALVPCATAQSASVWLMNSQTQEMHFSQTYFGTENSSDETRTLNIERDSNGDITHQRLAVTIDDDLLPSYTDYSYIKIDGNWYVSEEVNTNSDGKVLTRTSYSYSTGENKIMCEIRSYDCSQVGSPTLTQHKYEEMETKRYDARNETAVTYTLTDYIREFDGQPLLIESDYWIYRNGRLDTYASSGFSLAKNTETEEPVLQRTTVEYTGITWGGECTAEPANRLGNDWNNWLGSDDNGMLSYNLRKYVTESDTHVADGEVTSDTEIKLSRTVTGEGGLKKIVSIYDARPSYYNVREKEYTDNLGSYTIETKSYQDVTGDISADRLALTYTEDRKYSTMDNYKARYEWNYTLGTTSVRDESMKVERDPVYGYVTEQEADISINEYLDPEDPFMTTTYKYKWTFGDYHEYTPTAIAPVAAGSEAPTRIYNLQGVCLGSQLDTLPGGIYIVKKGSETVKVKK